MHCQILMKCNNPLKTILYCRIMKFALNWQKRSAMAKFHHAVLGKKIWIASFILVFGFLSTGAQFLPQLVFSPFPRFFASEIKTDSDISITANRKVEDRPLWAEDLESAYR